MPGAPLTEFEVCIGIALVPFMHVAQPLHAAPQYTAAAGNFRADVPGVGEGRGSPWEDQLHCQAIAMAPGSCGTPGIRIGQPARCIIYASIWSRLSHVISSVIVVPLGQHELPV